MTEAKRSPGRPRYTPEQRRAASIASFRRSLSITSAKGCVTSSRSHLPDHTGKSVRIRLFAWNYYHPEAQISNGNNLHAKCLTRRCVARDHLVLLDILDDAGNVVTPEVDYRSAEEIQEEATSTYHKELLAPLMTRWAERGIAPNDSQKESMRLAWVTRMLPESHPDCEERTTFIAEFVTDDEGEYRNIAEDWGIILS